MKLTARYLWAFAAAAALSACQPQAQHKTQAAAAPGPQNACLQLISAPGKQPQSFKPIAYEDPNLETCAVHLEGVRLEQQLQNVVGVWNGVFIFASAASIDSAAGLNEARYAVFSPDQRSQIDQSLSEQLASRKAASGKPRASEP